MQPELVRPGRVWSELRFAADAARGYLPRMPALLRHAACAAILVALSACATTPSAPGNAPSTETNAVQATPAHAFFAGLSALCGKAYAGRVVVDTPTPAKDPFAGKPLVMHVRECSADVIRIPFHVGDDRSRTWVVTRTASALRLKHDHRHQDGSEDAVTQYGGDSVDAGTAQRQAFPADAAVEGDVRDARSSLPRSTTPGPSNWCRAAATPTSCRARTGGCSAWNST